MKQGAQCIKIQDVGSDVWWYYDPRTRCAIEPKHYHAMTEIMTDQSAFMNSKTLDKTKKGDVVFIESHDHFYSADENGIYNVGHRVWRKSRVLGPAVFPGRK